MRWLMFALVLLAVACGGDDDDSDRNDQTDDVGEFAVEVGTQMVAGEWTEVYGELHPDQRAVVTQDQFVTCRSTLTSPAYEVTIGEVTPATDPSSGVAIENAWNAALTYQLEGYSTLAHTILVYEVDGDYYWAMGQPSLTTLQSGGCDIDPLRATQFAVSIGEAEIAGDWTTVYAGLHPNQQAVVPQDLFVECRSADTVQATAVEPVGVTMEEDVAAGIEATDTYAVTLKLSYTDQDPQNVTFHVYPIDGGFAWALGAESVAAFANGECD